MAALRSTLYHHVMTELITWKSSTLIVISLRLDAFDCLRKCKLFVSEEYFFNVEHSVR